ncbi:hypothetical protein K474DRAFT_1588706 [Panus rudis PR-1116 ss-1]|nr:hypothetical protein K474DRAFT_1588706 [Panus rudis PR-1116 ss-1]
MSKTIGTTGAFKSCHPASLHPMETGSSEKAPILTCEERVRHRYGTGDEVERLSQEANCIYWGQGLLEMTYQVVDAHLKALEESGQPPLEIHIPRLRFVHIGVAIPENPAGPAYLLEERISGDFVKYIVNSCAKPVQGLTPEQTEIALFLAFSQHARNYLYQTIKVRLTETGAAHLLTDCEIITHQ